jgi:pimeloyl-ACP methyl ester carboxylesterase
MIKLSRKLLLVLGALAAIAAVWAGHGFWVHIRYHGSVEEVTFQTGDITLRGWLVTPGGPGPHPAVVLLHGAGPQTGNGMPAKIYGNAFLRSGIAVLTYDKRGVGGSGGTFRRNRYRDFVDDGISAVRYLQSRSDVAAGSIGLFGSSESGWFVPEIALRAGDVAYIVNRVAPALPWIETNLWENRHELLKAGVEGETLEESLRLREQAWRFYLELDTDPALANGETWRRIDAELAAFDRENRGNYIPKLTEYDPEYYKSLAAFIGYDPQPYIEQIRIPMLYVYAENDDNVPTSESVAYLEALRAQEGRDIEIRVIPGVKHAMYSTAGVISGGITDPEFLEVIGPWAVAQVEAAESRAKRPGP